MNSTIEELANNSQVFLLRHATTDINLVTQRLASSNASKEEYVAECFNVKYRDCGLADVGIEECEKASDIAKSLTIHTVFVSPLIRSIQTAYHLFKDHPNFASIKFVIVPKAREEFISTDDMPLIPDFTVSEFADKFPHFDVSLFDEYKDKSLYFFEDLEESLREELAPQLMPGSADPLGNNAFKVFAKKVISCFPDTIESRYSIYKRAGVIKEMIRSYISKHKIPSDEKIILISHKSFLKIYTGKWNDDEINIEMKDPIASLKSSCKTEDEISFCFTVSFYIFIEFIDPVSELHVHTRS